MKKVLLYLIIVLIILAVAVALGKFTYNLIKTNSEHTNSSSNINEKLEENNNKTISTSIKQRDEFNTRALFDLGDGNTDVTIDLMANDMQYNSDNALYHKIITNMEDYTKYKERIDLPDLAEDDFNEIFLVIISNENVRTDSEKDLFIYDVYADGDITNIIMKQKENPKIDISDESQNNVFYAVVDKAELRTSAKVIIEK